MTKTVCYLPTAKRLAELFDHQDTLDRHILETHYPNGTTEDLLEMKIYALITEIAEALNEYRTFKFWSTDRAPRTDKLREELVDVLHFMISISQELDVHYPGIYILEAHDRALPAFGELINKAHALLFYKMNGFVIRQQEIEVLFAAYFGLIYQLGFTWEEIEQGYHRKNEINHTRQETAY